MKDRRCPSLAHSVTPLGVSFRGIAAVGLSRLCWRSGATLLSYIRTTIAHRLSPHTAQRPRPDISGRDNHARSVHAQRHAWR